MKSFVSIVLLMAILSSFLFVNAFADGETITLEIVGEPYSKNTLSGTIISTKSVANLSSGQEIVYFRNDVEVGRSSVAGTFNFTSVEGENHLVAKIISGNKVVATSNVIYLDFSCFIKGKTIKSSSLSNENDSMIFENDFLSSGWATFEDDPGADGEQKVLHVKEPTPAASVVTLPIAKFSKNEDEAYQGIIRADFEFYAEHFQGTLYSAHINVSCGCSHSQAGNADWPSGTAKSVSRAYTYPKKQWVKMSIVADCTNKIYDLYADGIQLVSAKPFCHNTGHSQSFITSVNLPGPGWAGTVKLYDEDGKPIYQTSDDGQPILDDKGNPVQKTEKHHGEFYLKNFECYELIREYISISAPKSVVAGKEFLVEITKKTGDEIEYIYNLNGTDSQITDSKRTTCFAKPGTNTLVVKILKNREVVATSEPVYITGHFAIPQNGFSVSLKGAELTETDNSKYEIMDMSETYPDYMEVAKFEVEGGSKTIYPQSGSSPFSSSSRSFHKSSNAADSDSYTFSYDINVQRLDGSAYLAFNYYFSGKEKYPSVFSLNKNGVMTVGIDSNNTKIPYNKNEWINLKIILLKENQTAYFLVNDVVVEDVLFSEFAGHEIVFENEVKFCFLSSNAEKGKNVIYVDNYKLGYGKLSRFAINHNLSGGLVPKGAKVKFDVINPYGYGNITYYHNGMKHTNTDGEQSTIPGYPGLNTVYAELTDDDGSVIATSEPVTFNVYADEFVSVYKKSVTTSVFSKHQKHVEDKYGINEFVEDYEKFSSDPEHGQVLKLSSSVSNFEGIKPNINILSTTRNHYIYLQYAKRMYTTSIDIYPESIQKNYLNVTCVSPTQSSHEQYFSFFRFDSKYLHISLNGDSLFKESVRIPLEKKWYTLKVVYDPMDGTYILIVNDVIYSVIKKSDPNSMPRFFDDKSLLYYDIALVGSETEGNPNVVYLDNYVLSYSELPEAHTEFMYATNTEYITSLRQISDSDNLTVSFVATKGEYDNVLCVATVLEKGGKLAKIATKKVTFEDFKDSEFVTLELEELPQNIADGDYTVNVMLWDAKTFKPIVAKTIFGN